MHTKINVKISLTIAILLFIVGIGPTVTSDNSLFIEEAGEEIKPHEAQYAIAEEIHHYVNDTLSNPLGIHTSPPPSGMGVDNEDATTLTETQYSSSSWSTIQSQSTFSSTPSGWSASGIDYFGGYFLDDGGFSGSLESSTVNTTDSSEVRFTLNIGGTWDPQLITVYFWNTTNEWAHIGDFEDGSEGDQSFSSTSVQFRLPGFKVRVTYGIFSGSESFQANDWRVEKRTPWNYHAFQGVYTFSDLSYNTHSIEELVIDFSIGGGTTENLAFRFEAGDSSPDYLLSIPDTSGNVDIVVNISQYLTGPLCYLDIRDTSRSSGDGDASGWAIDRMYIRLSEPSPVWDDVPSDRLLEYADPFAYQMNATFAPSLHTWWVNDTTHFAIDGSGLITNATIIPADEYGLLISANDTWGRTISDEVLITLLDTVDPVWTTPIVNQEEEYGASFQYILGAYDLAGIQSWNLNDSTDFQMDNGEITNNTILETGYYWLNVSVTDNNDNSISDIFRVFINDTVDPVWEFTPVNQLREYGLDFVYDLDATDLAGITWHINDETNFNIDSEGVITNITDLTVQTYGLLVMVEDSHGNIISASFNLLVNDTISPVWVSDPMYQILEYGGQFIYDLNSSDIAEITWLINNTLNFTIDSSTGVVSNITFLDIGNYSLHVTAIDSHGNTLEGYFILEVEDTIAPIWEVVPPIQELAYREQLSLQLYASDIAGIAQWLINDTATFNIDGSGFLTSLGNLEDGLYHVEVTAVDAHGLSSSLVISIFVALSATTTTTPPDPGLTLLLTIGGIALGAVVLFASLRTWKAVQRDRLKQIDDGKGEVDTALDYLESIKPDLEDKDT